MHLYISWFKAHKSIYVGLRHPTLCSFNKGYYLCCCNISFSCDSDVLQGCTFREKSISKHIFAEPPWALLLVRKASVWWCVRSGLILWEREFVCVRVGVCVCVQKREAHALSCCVCLTVLLQCLFSPLRKASVQVNNTIPCQKTQIRKDSVSHLV